MVAIKVNYKNEDIIKEGFYLGANACICRVKRYSNVIEIENYSGPVMLNNLQSFDGKILFIDIIEDTITFKTLDLEALIKNCEKTLEIKI